MANELSLLIEDLLSKFAHKFAWESKLGNFDKRPAALSNGEGYGGYGKVQSDLNPIEGIDISRLENEMENYQQWMDERTEDAYRIAEIVKDRKPRLQTICGNTKGCRLSW